jgi:hypothetical protein
LNIAVAVILVMMLTRWATGAFPKFLATFHLAIWIGIGVAMLAWTGLLTLTRVPFEEASQGDASTSVISNRGIWVKKYAAFTLISFALAWLLSIGDTVLRRVAP